MDLMVDYVIKKIIETEDILIDIIKIVYKEEKWLKKWIGFNWYIRKYYVVCYLCIWYFKTGRMKERGRKNCLKE